VEGEWEWGGGEEGRSGAEKLCMIALLFSSVGESVCAEEGTYMYHNAVYSS
jgi:hypothetical protein